MDGSWSHPGLRGVQQAAPRTTGHPLALNSPSTRIGVWSFLFGPPVSVTARRPRWLAACLFRDGRPKLRLMMPANSQSQGSVSLSSEMTCSEALRRHPERHLQSTLRPVAGDPCAPRRVLIQKKPPEVPSKKNVLLQVLLSTVQYSIADPPILSSSPRNGSRTARNGDM